MRTEGRSSAAAGNHWPWELHSSWQVLCMVTQPEAGVAAGFRRH